MLRFTCEKKQNLSKTSQSLKIRFLRFKASQGSLLFYKPYNIFHDIRLHAWLFIYLSWILVNLSHMLNGLVFGKCSSIFILLLRNAAYWNYLSKPFVYLVIHLFTANYFDYKRQTLWLSFWQFLKRSFILVKILKFYLIWSFGQYSQKHSFLINPSVLLLWPFLNGKCKQLSWQIC